LAWVSLKHGSHGRPGGCMTEPMPPPPPMRQYALKEAVDALVIGTGAGGAPLMARLAQAGLSVVALEAGPLFDASRDFATDELAQHKLFWNHERLSAGSDPLAFGANNSGTGVGGSTLHYTAYVPRPQPTPTWNPTMTSWRRCSAFQARLPTPGAHPGAGRIRCRHCR